MKVRVFVVDIDKVAENSNIEKFDKFFTDNAIKKFAEEQNSIYTLKEFQEEHNKNNSRVRGNNICIRFLKL